MKNSNVLKNNCSHNSDISIGSCEILSKQVEKIFTATDKLSKYFSERGDFYSQMLFSQIYNSLNIINCVVIINLDNFFNE